MTSYHILFGIVAAAAAVLVPAAIAEPPAESVESGPNPDPESDSDAQVPLHHTEGSLPYGYPYPGLPFASLFGGGGVGGNGGNVRVVFVERPKDGATLAALKPETVSVAGTSHPIVTQPLIHHALPVAAAAVPVLKANCTLDKVKVEGEEVCQPGSVVEDCQTVDTKYMKVETVEQCYDVTRTICQEDVNEQEIEVCSYQFKPVTRQESASGVYVGFTKSSHLNEVDICVKKQVYSPNGYGSPTGGYGIRYENVCVKGDQEVKVVSPDVHGKQVSVHVTVPEPVRTCVTKRVQLPMLDCRDETETKCTMAPKIVEEIEPVKVCRYSVAPDQCQDADLDLPIQTCTETVEEKLKSNYPPPLVQHVSSNKGTHHLAAAA